LVSGKKYRRAGIAAAKTGGRILLQYEGTMDSRLFERWFESVPMGELAQPSVIVMDNAAFHRKARLVQLAEEHGHRLIFLPPYSPELNPIENFWAWLKAKLRRTLADFSCFDDALCYCFKSI
jgi:transposase